MVLTRRVEIRWGPRGRDAGVQVGGHHHPPGVEAQHLGVVRVEGARRAGGRGVHRLPVLHPVQLLLPGEAQVRQVRQVLRDRTLPPMLTCARSQLSIRRHRKLSRTEDQKRGQVSRYSSMLRLSGCSPSVSQTGRTAMPLSQPEPTCSSAPGSPAVTTDQLTPQGTSPCLKPPPDKGHRPFPPHHCLLQSILHSASHLLTRTRTHTQVMPAP